MVDPWVVGAVAIAGGILLLFGGRLLRPTLVLAVISLGAWLGLDLAEGTRISPESEGPPPLRPPSL